MKKSNRLYVAVLTGIISLMLLSSVAFAQGTTSINIANNYIGMGDTTTVSVSASVDGKITVKYTASLLSIVDCSAADYISDGNTIEFNATEAELTFEGVGEGTASIIVSSESCAGSSATIEVGAAGSGDTATVIEGGAEQVTSSSSGIGTVNDDGGFDIDGVKYVVSERYSDNQILDGFSKFTLKLGTHTYSELTNGSIILVYLKPADNTKGDGVFYVYNEATGTCAPFNYLGSKDDYVLVQPFSGDKPSESFIQSALATDSGTYEMLTLEGSDFYYFIGMSQTGETDWYSYDSRTGKVARADYTALSMIGSASDTAYEIIDSSNSTQEDTDTDNEENYTGIENYQQKLAKFRIVVSVLIVICVILVFVIINLMLGKKGDEDDPFAKDIDFSRSKKRQRSIIFEDKDETDEETDEYEEDEDAEDELDGESGDSDSTSPDETTPEDKKENKTNSNSNGSNDFLIDFNDL